ncbi:MAG: 3-isopropylmalate dehydratase large subunit [Betaproteobacteria bacterium]|jgi:3-isopropylmalate/(R)-2-methylmalate dehydratase large subunit|nr:3-isopropylmalate dehydratase large subunit [Betaproteobacteria bacterium]
MAQPRSMFQKIWDAHTVKRDQDSGEVLLYVDRLILTDTSSFHAFDLLRAEGYKVRHPRTIFGEPDHFAASRGPALSDVVDAERRTMVAALEENCRDFGLVHFGLGDPRMGISHVVGPEQGITLPGLFLLCGDSHTSTHGALGALAFGIGGQTAHIMATQCIWQRPLKNLRITVEGERAPGVSAKDVILGIIRELGPAGGFGHVIEYAGPAIRAMSIEERLTVCNMSIEAGARSGMVAPDDTTIAYVKGRPEAPRGEQWDRAVAYWRSLPSDPGARFDRELSFDAGRLSPMVSWGNTAADVVAVDGRVPDPAGEADADRRRSMQRALDYMGLAPGQAMHGLPIDQVFIGSCTNGRIEDLRAAASVARGRRATVPALVVPGSGLVKAQAEAEGLDRIFIEAGFHWGHPGCSMCVGTNGDTVGAGKRCVSTSNRNFVGRQGPGSRTHLASPLTAAASAIAGRVADARDYLQGGA